MHPDKDNLRILALDLRSGRFGFAVFESSRELIEWGTRRSRRTTRNNPVSFIRKQLVPLIKFYAPAVIVVGRGSPQAGNFKHRYLMSTIMDEVQQQAVEVMAVERKEVQTVFSKSGRANKETIANQVALAFPQLTWKLPPARKAWMNEAHIMTVFDAVALGLTYLSRFENVPPGDGVESPMQMSA